MVGDRLMGARRVLAKLPTTPCNSVVKNYTFSFNNYANPIFQERQLVIWCIYNAYINSRAPSCAACKYCLAYRHLRRDGGGEMRN